MANQALRHRRGRKVAPDTSNGDDIIEIRPGRSLRIRHLNPKKRDEKFAKEMSVYLQYRETGVMSGPMVASRISTAKTNNTNIELITTANGNKATEPSVSDTINREKNLPGINGNGTGNHSDNHDTDNNMERTEGWVASVGTVDSMDKQNNHAERAKRSTIQTLSPSRNSIHSQGVQSASGVHVSVSRPSSDARALVKIGEANEIEGQSNDVRKDSVSKSFKSPRKTKDHRPTSAKSIRKGAKSIALSDVSDTLSNIQDLTSDINMRAHLESSFKDVTLFFIHGVGGSADVWTAQLNFFAGLGLEVIAPDLIGHGFSCCPDTQRFYHFNEILADMEAMFDKYCKKQNIIIGHSYGCAFAAALGRRRARRVCKLVLMSGGAPVPLAPQPGVFSLPVCCLTCIKPCLFSRFERNAFHNVKDSGVTRELALDVPVYVLSHMMHGQDWMDGDELYHQWLTAPTLLLHGKYDRFVSLDEEMEMEKAIYCSTLEVIDNSSHMIMMEAPHVVNHKLYDFIFKEQHIQRERSTVTAETPRHVMSARSTRPKSSKHLA